MGSGLHAWVHPNPGLSLSGCVTLGFLRMLALPTSQGWAGVDELRGLGRALCRDSAGRALAMIILLCP